MEDAPHIEKVRYSKDEVFKGTEYDGVTHIITFKFYNNHTKGLRHPPATLRFPDGYVHSRFTAKSDGEGKYIEAKFTK